MDLFIIFNIIETTNEVSANYAYFLISISVIGWIIKGDFFYNIIDSDVHIFYGLCNMMDRIYIYNPDATYKPNRGRYLQLITAKDLYIQNITVSGHDCFQVKFPNFFSFTVQ